MHNVDFERGKCVSETEKIRESKKEAATMANKITKRKRSTKAGMSSNRSKPGESNLIGHQEDQVTAKVTNSPDIRSVTFQVDNSSLKDSKASDNMSDCSKEGISTSPKRIPTSVEENDFEESTISNIEDLVTEGLAYCDIETRFDESLFDNVDENSTFDRDVVESGFLSGDEERLTFDKNVVENLTFDNNFDESGFASFNSNFDSSNVDIDSTLYSTMEEEEMINQSLSKLLLENPNLINILQTQI